MRSQPDRNNVMDVDRNELSKSYSGINVKIKLVQNVARSQRRQQQPMAGQEAEIKIV